jgi:hypothetical protein
VSGCCDTINQSVFGPADPKTWGPLSIKKFFSEGWNKPWVPSPNGSGGAPRQGWINAANGNFYRLWFLTFSEGFNSPPKNTSYLGDFTLYTPFSRRLMLITNVPFVVHDNVLAGLPFIDPNQPGSSLQSDTGFGDISFTPRVLLHETNDFSLTSELSVTVPTGKETFAGKTQLIPNVAFWSNIGGGWVIRGGFGDQVTLDGGNNTLISQVAFGQTVTAHDVRPFGDFTYYLSTVADTPLPNGHNTSVSLTPGIRTHLGNNWYFLAGLPIPVTKDRVADLGMIFWFMKAW